MHVPLWKCWPEQKCDRMLKSAFLGKGCQNCFLVEKTWNSKPFVTCYSNCPLKSIFKLALVKFLVGMTSHWGWGGICIQMNIYTHIYKYTYAVRMKEQIYLCIIYSFSFPPPKSLINIHCNNTLYGWPLGIGGFWPQFSIESSSFSKSPGRFLYCFWCVMRSNYECLSVPSSSTERFIVHVGLLISELLAIASDWKILRAT